MRKSDAVRIIAAYIKDEEDIDIRVSYFIDFLTDVVGFRLPVKGDLKSMMAGMNNEWEDETEED